MTCLELGYRAGLWGSMTQHASQNNPRVPLSTPPTSGPGSPLGQWLGLQSHLLGLLWLLVLGAEQGGHRQCFGLPTGTLLPLLLRLARKGRFRCWGFIQGPGLWLLVALRQLSAPPSFESAYIGALPRTMRLCQKAVVARNTLFAQLRNCSGSERQAAGTQRCGSKGMMVVLLQCLAAGTQGPHKGKPVLLDCFLAGVKPPVHPHLLCHGPLRSTHCQQSVQEIL